MGKKIKKKKKKNKKKRMQKYINQSYLPRLV